MSGEPEITIVGTCGGEPELRFTPPGAAVVNFSVVVNSRKKQGDEWVDDGATWYRCNAWRQMAENIAESFKKGDRVIVQGKLKMREYESRDGGTGKSLEITVDAAGPDTRFAQTRQQRPERQQGGDGQGYQQQRPQQQDQWQDARPANRQAPPQDPWQQPRQRPQQPAPAAPTQGDFYGEPPFHHSPIMDQFEV